MFETKQSNQALNILKNEFQNVTNLTSIEKLNVEKIFSNLTKGDELSTLQELHIYLLITILIKKISNIKSSNIIDLDEDLNNVLKVSLNVMKSKIQ